MDQRFRECQNRQNDVETRGDVRSVRNQVAEIGLEYFCLDYVSKNGVSVTEHNIQLHHVELYCQGLPTLERDNSSVLMLC